MLKFARAFFVVLILCASLATSVTKAGGAATRGADLRDIIRFADRITNRSGCLGAGCVRMSCEETPQLWRAMLTAQWTAGAIDETLIALRDMEMPNAIQHMKNNGQSQDRTDFVNDVQLVQDSISVVYVAASEIASVLDLKESLAKNAGEWKKVFSGKSPLDKFALLKDIKSIASRANSFSKYSDIGRDKKQKMPWADIAKAAAEGRLRYEELVRKQAEGSLTTESRRKAWLSQLKDLADIALKIDRMLRQGRIAEYQRDAMSSLDAAQAAAETMAEINKTRRLATDAQVAVNRAIRAFFACYSAACRGAAKPAPALKSMSWIPVEPKLSTLLRMREYDKRLRAARDDLAVGATAYAPIIDVTSRLEVERKRTLFNKDIVVRHAIQQFRVGQEVKRCIPEDAWLTVVRGTNEGTGQSIMDVGPASPSPGKTAFKVQEDLAGVWRSSGNPMEIEIGTNNDTVLITQKDTPVVGRKRVYTGTLVRQFSQPGNYTLVLRDADDRSYLPVHFTVEGPNDLVEKTLTAYSNPSEIADISPAVPEDIRSKLLDETFRDKIRYRANVALRFDKEGKLALKIEFHNHRVKFAKKKRTIKSVAEKLWFEGEFERVE